MEMIKLYRPEERSVVNGQVLQEAYTFSKARVVVQEMIDALSLDLFRKSTVLQISFVLFRWL